MYAQIFFVTSVRGAVFTPHTAARASESFLGAKMPTPFFFMAAAIFLPFAFAGLAKGILRRLERRLRRLRDGRLLRRRGRDRRLLRSRRRRHSDRGLLVHTGLEP